MLDKLLSYLRTSWEDLIFFGLLLAASALLMFELTSLFVAPIADSYLWWGDESWLMTEFRTQMLTGVFRHPYALSSSLAHGSGLIFGNMWLTAALYGLPATLAKSSDVVMIGRTVTALLSVTLAFVLYECIRKLSGERLLALFGVIVLVTSRSFLLTSHSARYDILSALAILVGVAMAMMHLHIHIGKRSAFLAGLSIAATLLISVHVVLALGLAALVVVHVRSQAKAWSTGLFLLGVATIGIILYLLSHIIGIPSVNTTSGSFALNIHDIPALRLFSRSVQIANLLQRWSTITSFAFGYVILAALVLLLTVVRGIRKSGRLNIPAWTWLIVIVLLSWLELESAAPTSYLIYILPVLSLGIALTLKATTSKGIASSIVVLCSAAMFYFAFHDSWQARKNGLLLTRANDDAIGAASAEIEQDTTHPLVLAFNPAVHRLMTDSAIRLMTTHFIEFPISIVPVDSILRSEHVRYVLVYRSALKPDYMREVEPITNAAKRAGTLVWERTSAILTDVGRSYFDTSMSGHDTLRVYKIRE
ncbi:MAG: hypothetical protein Q8922_09880 [Bacteroidota bacterium]|nr:hypothetical protein [Bacteroidota bacterium]MDP4232864.1 hypothetical protein [Bacteroidota bacterium]MDP4241908.1 hypothetical protein [Bacteroidota bacterium]MDP4288233.1 hypothetical protein [Bacteroidota bacterium]